jgi:hypothetical protein
MSGSYYYQMLFKLLFRSQRLAAARTYKQSSAPYLVVVAPICFAATASCEEAPR